MKYLVSLLFCLTASAQLPVIPFVVPNSGISADLTGVAYRWVFSDITTNTTVTSWVDRIQGSTWVNGAVAKQPTNSAQGIWIDSTHYLTNNGMQTINGWSNCTFGFIWTMKDTGKFSGEVHPMFLNNTVGLASDTSATLGDGFDFTGYPLMFQADAVFADISESPFKATNVVSDLVIDQAVTNNSQIGYRSYTNGIADGVSLGGSGHGNYWGTLSSTSTPVVKTNIPNVLGINFGRTSSARFFIRELWVWTNLNSGTADRKFPATLLQHFHQYSTNTYNYSP